MERVTWREKIRKSKIFVKAKQSVLNKNFNYV